MSIVVDANVIVALILPLTYSEIASQRFAAWKNTGRSLAAPLLIQYEVVAVLRKAVVGGWLTSKQAEEAGSEALTLGVDFAQPTVELHKRALFWAERLGQSKSYDTQYIALAEQLRAELWTADRRLANGASQQGIDWVKWIGAE